MDKLRIVVVGNHAIIDGEVYDHDFAVAELALPFEATHRAAVDLRTAIAIGDIALVPVTETKKTAPPEKHTPAKKQRTTRSRSAARGRS